MFKLIGRKIITILRSKFLLNWAYWGIILLAYFAFLGIYSSVGDSGGSAFRFSEACTTSLSSWTRSCCIRQSNARNMFSLSFGFV